MKAWLRTFFSSVITIALVACVGGGGTSSGPAGTGPIGNSGGDGADLGSASNGGAVPVTTISSGQASSDGTLGSQSSNVDLEPYFYRTHTLNFAGETGPKGAWFSYALPKIPGTLPKAQVLKINQSLSDYQEIPCLACEGQYLRALNCGSHSNAEILQTMPPEEHNNPSASNPLLWYVLHMPRSYGNSDFNTCEGGIYRDFPVKESGTVDLSEFKLHPDDIVVFYLLPKNLPNDVPPLSEDSAMQISKDGIAASASNGMLRFVRPSAPLSFSPQIFQVIQMP